MAATVIQSSVGPTQLGGVRSVDYTTGDYKTVYTTPSGTVKKIVRGRGGQPREVTYDNSAALEAAERQRVAQEAAKAQAQAQETARQAEVQRAAATRQRIITAASVLKSSPAQIVQRAIISRASPSQPTTRLQVQPAQTTKPSFFGIPEKQKYEQEAAEYKETIKRYPTQKVGSEEFALVPENQYASVQKEYQDVVNAESLWRETPYQKIKAAKEKVMSYVSPFSEYSPGGKGKYVSIGGKFIPREEWEKLPEYKKRLVQVLQPENILAMTSFPKFEETKAIFTSAEKTAKGGKQVSTVIFKTSTGEQGTALGVTKAEQVGKNMFVGRTDVVGIKGTPRIFSKGTSYKYMKDISSFKSSEVLIGMKKGDEFIFVSGGPSVSSTKPGFQSFIGATYGVKENAVTKILGASGTTTKYGGMTTSFIGNVLDLGKKGTGVTKVFTGGKSTHSSLTKLLPTIAEAATKSAVSAAVGGITVTSSKSLFPLVAASALKKNTSPKLSDVSKPGIQSSYSVSEQQKFSVELPIPKFVELPRQDEISKSGFKGGSGTVQREGTSQVPSVIQYQPVVQLPGEQQIQIPSVFTPLQPELTRPRQVLVTSSGFSVKSPPKKTIKGINLKDFSSLYSRPPQFFPVNVRRFGKWFTVGRVQSEKKAFSLGKSITEGTLAVSFKVPGTKARKIPGYKTKSTKGGTIYIEQLGKRLKRGTKEIPEIQSFRAARPRKLNLPRLKL